MTRLNLRRRTRAAALMSMVALSSPVHAGSDTDQAFAVHAQSTFVLQADGSFRSSFQGPNSLDHRAQAKETFDLTLYGGLRLWKGSEIWVDPEIDQGFGLSNTLGVAGFPSGEAYKVGKAAPYAKIPRWFLRQTIELGGIEQTGAAGLINLRSRTTSNRLVITAGKFSVVDVFDTNDQAHDPRSDFLNWTIIDAGTFDYAANAWGYTYGAAAELYEGPWTMRGGAFALSDIPNSERLDSSFRQNELVAEIEHRHAIAGQPGKAKITIFRNRGRMGSFADAIRSGLARGQAPDISAVRKLQSRAGISFNLEQQLSSTASVFFKGGIADGKVEPYEFTDVDRSFTAGASIKGGVWGRTNDALGLAFSINRIGKDHERFLALGGLGILIGDGKLVHSAPEQILEIYYDLPLRRVLHLSLDGQWIRHPAYNRDRGPVPVGAVRLHAQF